MVHEDITEKIIGVFYEVYNNLGYGFLENVYENAMVKEFGLRGIKCVSQYPINVYYKEEVVGKYIADFLIEDKVIVELKAIREISKCDESQLLNYLTATNKNVGLLLNFGEAAQIKRKIFQTSKRKYSSNL